MGEDGGEIARARKESGEKETERRAETKEEKELFFLRLRSSSPLPSPPLKTSTPKKCIDHPTFTEERERKKKKGRMARSVDSSVAAAAAPFLFFSS